MAQTLDPFALVVDDDPLIVMHACEILSEVGFRPIEAHSASEAIDVLDQRGDSITLLFSDVEMGPGMDGFELARKVAKTWPDVEIVIASGRIRPNPGDMPPNATFLPKPFSAEMVRDHLAETLPDGKKPEPLKQLA